MSLYAHFILSPNAAGKKKKRADLSKWIRSGRIAVFM